MANLTQEQLDQELDYWRWELGEHQDSSQEFRDSRWHSRLHAIQGMIKRFEEEQDRRLEEAAKLQRLGSLSLESHDPAQLALDFPATPFQLTQLQQHFRA